MAGKWHKNTAVETAGPAWEAQNTGCLHFCLLAQNFSFSWDFHSLLSPEGEEKKKSQLFLLFLHGGLESQQGSTFKWQILARLKLMQSHSWTWALKLKKGTGRLMPRPRSGAAHAGPDLSTEKQNKKPELITVPSTPAREKLKPQMPKTLFTEALPARVWMTFSLVQSKLQLI